MTNSARELYGFELEPEVRDWLDSLADSDYKRVDEVCGLLAEKGTELGGPWSPASTSSGRSTARSARRRPASATTAAPRRRRTKGRCEMTSYHTRWQRPEEPADDPERLAIREALAFGKALFDVRTTLGLSVAELAMRASLTEDDIECIEEGGTEPTIPLLRRLAADVHLTAGHDLGSVWFETHAA